VDTLPMSKQQQGSSWASRMVAVGSLIGYGAGAIDLKNVFGGVLGDTQFKQLTAVAALTLCLAVGVTSWAVTEKVRVLDGEEEKISPLEVLQTIAKTAMDLPRGIQAICYVQFWAWIGMSNWIWIKIWTLTGSQDGSLSCSTAPLGSVKYICAMTHHQKSRQLET
jgi:solute carrier family 45 protein 1/2/4